MNSSGYAVAPCTVAGSCQVQIPFSGSGITIYVLQAGIRGVNASLTIDGGTPQYNALPAPPAPSFYSPNVTLFSVQGITTGNHTATMTVQSWENGASGMMFDYASINQTIVSPTTTTTSLASSTTALTTPNPTTATAASTTLSLTTTTSPSLSSSTVNVGAVVGGVIGGPGVLGLLLIAFSFYRTPRRRAPVLSTDLDAGPKIEPFSLEQPNQHGPKRYDNVPQSTTTGGLATSSASTHTPLPTMNPVSALRGRPRLVVTNPSIGQEHPTLSDNQADFVNNMPASVIARVIERMITGERRPVVDGYDSFPPPSYRHAPVDT